VTDPTPEPAQPHPNRALRNAELAYARLREDALRYRARLEQSEAELVRVRTRLGRVRAGRRKLESELDALRASLGVRGGTALRRWLGPWFRFTTALGARRRRPAAAPAPHPDVQVTTYDAWRRLDPARLRERADAAARAGARLREQAVPLESLRVAAIVDDFTAQTFGPDCRLLNLNGHDWATELETFQPHLLFVESIWRGRDGSWQGIFAATSPDLVGVLDWCRERAIPTVFWNKEDPVHFQSFIRIAAEFDHVFTTDVDRVGDYLLRLGHDRVHFLPFAAQPRLHDPVETLDRRAALCFAGAYYPNFPTRMRDLDEIVRGASRVVPVEIFDRNYGTVDPGATFPEEYRDLIVGTLAPDELDVAYKGYQLGLTVNTIKSSQTMFARRVLELLASNTATISNYARGVRVLLGDLVALNDSADGTQRALEELTAHPDRTERLRAVALRTVLREHTSRSRLEYVVATVTGTAPDATAPLVTVVVVEDQTPGTDRAVALARTQRDVRVEVVLVTDRAAGSEPGVRRVRRDELATLGAGDLLGAGSAGLAVFDPRDWYGEDYLRDLVDATAWTDADVIGKAAHHRAGEDGAVTRVPGATYQPVRGIALRRGLLDRAAAQRLPAGVLLAEDPVDAVDPALRQMAVHPFDYCAAGGRLDPSAGVCSRLDVQTGIPLARLNEHADDVSHVLASLDGPVVALDSAGFHPGRRVADKVRVSLDDELLLIEARLPGAQTGRVLARGLLDVRTAWPTGRVTVGFAAEGSLPVQLVLRFLDESGRAVGDVTCHPHANRELDLPPGATHARIIWRVTGSGRTTIGPLRLHPRPCRAPLAQGSTDLLVVTNRYPTYADLYRNGFVHSRVRRYRSAGLATEVFELRDGHPVTHAEFEGVEVTSADAGVLRAILATGRHRTVAIHFLDDLMWNVVRSAPPTIRFLIWAHGAEIQPWWRRRCVFEGVADMAPVERASDARMALWRDVVTADLPNVEVVFVSEYLAETAQADLGHALPAGRAHVIANPIDTDIFGYAPKPAEQRHRVLSIRPYASRIYANDLAVAAVRELRDEPWFDELSFLVVGDGPLFEDTVAPLRDLPNVTIRQAFLRQAEIAALHREHGVMLIPSRGDTHGVSRDEAMASGLVPVTTAVGAVPEFVGADEGYVVPEEDHVALADALRDLHRDPDGFARRSAAAAARIRRTTSADVTIAQEIAVIRGGAS
jgi:glycosyltransferase involved in cell wall biosynthesis